MGKKISIASLLCFMVVFSQTSLAIENTYQRGAKVYEQNCAACHQATGQGIPGVFPPQKAHTPEMYNHEDGIGGRDYLNHVVQYGLTGPISVNGKDYNGNMPAWAGALSNEQIADVLNYVLTAFDNKTILSKAFKPYTAQEIKAVSGQNINGKDVYQLRLKLTGQNSASQISKKSVQPPSSGKMDLPFQKAFSSPVYVALQKTSLIENLPSKNTWEGVNGAHYMGLNADGSMMLASGFKTGNVYQINNTSGKLIATYPLNGTIQGVKISPDGKYGIAAIENTGQIAIIDLTHHQLIKKLNAGKTPHNIIFNHAGTLAYVTLQGEGAIAVIDMKTMQVSHKIITPGMDTPHNLDITSDDRYLWVRDFIGYVGVLDLRTEKVIKYIKVGNGHGGIDILPDQHLVATGAISDSYVTLIDAKTHEVVAKPQVGTGPHGVRASLDSQYIYASVTADNTVAVINAKTFNVDRIQTLAGEFPFWIAVPGNF